MSADPMRDEHKALKAQVRASRREFARSADSAFVREMRQVMDDYSQARADGVSREDACRGIEAVLRTVWSRPATKFPEGCDACVDTGYRPRVCCHEMRCGRRWCANQHPAWEHAFVEVCGCIAGDRMKRQVQQMDDAVAAVGRMAKKKQRGWSAIGR